MAGTESDSDHPDSGGESELDVTEDIDTAELSDESSAEEGNNFLDIEALESGSEGDEDSLLAHVELTFPQFCRLPIELRHRIWDFFDPYMRAPARVYSFNLVKTRDETRQYEAWAGPTLEQQAGPARAVLGTHRESRALALRFYPDTALFAHGTAMIPCHKGRDIIRIIGPWHQYRPFSWDAGITDLLKGVKQIAFDAPATTEGSPFHNNEDIWDLIDSETLSRFSDLEKIYICTNADEYRAEDIQWCVLDSTHKFYVETEEEEPGLGEDLQFMYCWPKVTDDTEKPNHIVPFQDEPEKEYTGAAPQVLTAPNGTKAFQMIQFTFDSGLRRFDQIREATYAGDFADYHSDEDSNPNSDSEENEYESEGIDDATIDEDSEGSESEDDLLVRQSSPHESESAFGGFSPLQGEVEAPSGEVEVVEVGSSSIESGSPRITERDPSDSDTDHVNARKTKRGRRGVMSSRRVMADSDDEDDDEVTHKPVRRADSRAHIISSDSEDDEGSTSRVQASKTARRGRVVLSDSDDDDNDSAAGVATSKRRQRGANKAEIQEESNSDDQSATENDDTSEDESEESSEDDEPPKKLSLAERIGAFRAAVPVGDDESASDAGYDEFNDDGEAEYGRSGYDEFQDDEEDGEPSEQDDMVMDMAEERLSDEDEDEEW